VFHPWLKDSLPFLNRTSYIACNSLEDGQPGLDTKGTMISVHDNNVYGCSLDFKHQRLTLHTCFLDRSPHEYTDVVFHGVVAHHFERHLSDNILFDIAEVSATAIVEANADWFSDSWRYGWPPIDYRGDLSLLCNELQNQSINGFEIQSSYGLDGWVLCKSCDRLSRVEVAIIN
jgi:hypothetical protein